MTQHATYTLNEIKRITPFGLHSGISVTIQNNSDEDNVYIGNEDVTTNSFGISLSPAAGISVDLPNSHDSLYAIGDTTSSEISILIVSL